MANFRRRAEGGARRAGADPAEVEDFAGPGKRDPELLQAVAAGVLVNVESMRELPNFAAAAKALGVQARVAVRVDDFELKGSGMKMGGGPKQFGVDVEVVPELLDRIATEGRGLLSFEGFHLFSGSQNLRAESICEAQRKSYELARLASDASARARFLNLGGGFGIPYFPGETRLELAQIGDNLAALVERARREMRRRASSSSSAATSSAGETHRRPQGITGPGLPRCRRRAAPPPGGLRQLRQVVRKNYPVAVSSKMASSLPTEPASLVRPLCTPLDILADRMTLPVAAVGDLAVVFRSGAYGASSSPGHPSCVEVLV
ncbi:MAG: pyridoxal-dependent decarboxylase, exosortase A system-associated [Rubrivivax sp.]